MPTPPSPTSPTTTVSLPTATSAASGPTTRMAATAPGSTTSPTTTATPTTIPTRASTQSGRTTAPGTVAYRTATAAGASISTTPSAIWSTVARPSATAKHGSRIATDRPAGASVRLSPTPSGRSRRLRRTPAVDALFPACAQQAPRGIASAKPASGPAAGRRGPAKRRRRGGTAAATAALRQPLRGRGLYRLVYEQNTMRGAVRYFAIVIVADLAVFTALSMVWAPSFAETTLACADALGTPMPTSSLAPAGLPDVSDCGAKVDGTAQDEP